MEPTLVSQKGFFRSFPLTVENGNFAPLLHIRIIRPASAFRWDPIYVFSRILDIARFAMDTVLRVDNKAWI